VSEIAVIGHSMGGLLARSACHYAPVDSWRGKVRHVFMLGTPHKGAPLELAANTACHGLSRLPETRPFATPIKIRAAGVKDLGYGYVVDEDWQGNDPDAFWYDNTGTVVPFLTSANHYFVSATLSRNADAPSACGWATCSSCARAPGRTRAAASASSSRSTATATSGAPPTWTCSTIPRSTTSCAAG
jgi:pimeloyl-ACP methyl ester carboxylesterase